MVLHSECVEPWAEAFKAKQEKARAAKLKKATAIANRVLRERKAAMKTIPDLIKEAQREFNHFIRVRDADKPCICCGKALASEGVGGGFDCGHYRSVGSAPHLRFDERNAHGQTKHCNRYGAGRAVDYRIGLIARLGVDVVEQLEADNRVHKWQRDELIAIRDLYRQKRRDLERSKE